MLFGVIPGSFGGEHICVEFVSFPVYIGCHLWYEALPEGLKHIPCVSVLVDSFQLPGRDGWGIWPRTELTEMGSGTWPCM